MSHAVLEQSRQSGSLVIQQVVSMRNITAMDNVYRMALCAISC